MPFVAPVIKAFLPVNVQRLLFIAFFQISLAHSSIIVAQG
jgi:hypothetical protein